MRTAAAALLLLVACSPLPVCNAAELRCAGDTLERCYDPPGGAESGWEMARNCRVTTDGRNTVAGRCCPGASVTPAHCSDGWGTC